MILSDAIREKIDSDLDFRLLYIMDSYESGRLNGIYYGPETSVRRPTAQSALGDLIEASGARYIDPDFALSLMKADAPGDNFLYRPLEKLCGKFSPQFQKRGTCVGQGNKLGGDDTMAIAHFAGGKKWIGRLAVAFAYAGGRVESAKQPGNWDGSNSDWTLDFFVMGGCGFLKDLGLPENALDADEELAVKWAADRRGIPDTYEPMCKANMFVKSFTTCRSAEEVHKYLENNISVVNDSNIWATGKRDSQGFSQAGRQNGGHCQLYRACRKTGKSGILNQNSWGPNWASGGTFPDDQPVGSVWESDDVIDARCKQNGTFAIFPTDVPKPPEIDWGLLR